MIKRNGFIALVLFFLVISVLANVYSFQKNDTTNKSYIKEIEELKKEIKSKSSKKNEGSDPKKDNEENQDKENDKQDDDPQDKISIENTVKRFIEYAFNNDAESYSTRKKMARNYMTEEFYDTLFSADGINEEQQKIKIQVDEIEVFISSEDDEKVIVKYSITESKAQDNYEETTVKFSSVSLINEGENKIVSDISPLTLNDWGI